jgi:hypothetical protein
MCFFSLQFYTFTLLQFSSLLQKMRKKLIGGGETVVSISKISAVRPWQDRRTHTSARHTTDDYIRAKINQSGQ